MHAIYTSKRVICYLDQPDQTSSGHPSKQNHSGCEGWGGPATTAARRLVASNGSSSGMMEAVPSLIPINTVDRTVFMGIEEKELFWRYNW